nr:aldehyde dehydrogenase family protein [Saccharopolyspora erythraea]
MHGDFHRRRRGPCRPPAPRRDQRFVGPSVFDHVTPEMEIYREDIFDPVLSVLCADSPRPRRRPLLHPGPWPADDRTPRKHSIATEPLARRAARTSLVAPGRPPVRCGACRAGQPSGFRWR